MCSISHALPGASSAWGGVLGGRGVRSGEWGMDWTELITYAIGAVLIPLAAYFVRRMNRLESKDEEAAEEVRRERDDLKRRVGELEATTQEQQREISELRVEAAKVQKLEQQIETITRSLKEQQAKYDDAMAALSSERRENERLKVENAQLQQQIHDMTITVTSYKDALNAVGARIMQIDKAAPDQPERGAEQSESTDRSGEEKPNGTQ